MMTKIASAAAVLLVAGSAFAQGSPFTLTGTVNFGDSDLITQSLGIAPTTSFYNHSFGNSNGGPNPGFLGAFPELEWDSYWAIGAGPNTTAGEFSAPYAGSGLPITVSETLAENGAGFATPGVGAPSTLKEVNGVLSESLFLARLTTVGAGSGLLASDGSAAYGRVGLNNNSNVVLTLNGASNTGNSNDGTIQNYWLVSETQEVEIGGVIHVVHDLYVVTAVPTPGAVALFGLAGMAATRRRRG